MHLDAVYWRPGWRRPDDVSWRASHDALVAQDRWILDGSYVGTLGARLQRADSVIWLDLARPACLRGVLGRWARHPGQPVNAPGCPERLDLEFLRWVWRYPRDTRPRVASALARFQGPVVRLTTRIQADGFARSLARTAGRP